MARNRSPSALSIKNQLGSGLRFTYGVPSRSASLRLPNLKNPAQDRHSRALHAVPSYGDVIPRQARGSLVARLAMPQTREGRTVAGFPARTDGMFTGVLDRLDGHLQ
jgi:hypothetical protein